MYGSLMYPRGHFDDCLILLIQISARECHNLLQLALQTQEIGTYDKPEL